MSIASDAGVLHVLSAGGMRLPHGLLQIAAAGDTLLLVHEASWLAVADDRLWASLPAGVDVLALDADLALRGLATRALHARVRRGDDTDWVIASERHARSISWGAS